MNRSNPRRGGRQARRDRYLRRKDQETEHRRRLCCGTRRHEPHARACERDEAMCGTKVAFDQPSDAQRAAARLAGRRPDWLVRAYDCPWCGMYHLTARSTLETPLGSVDAQT